MTKAESLQKLINAKNPSNSLSKVFEHIQTIKGDKGDKGDTGYSPVKGKDYYTEKEINTMIEFIQSKVKDGPMGPMGPVGIDGKNGETPIRGVDYWTEKDQARILKDVLAQIPKPKDGISPKTEDIVNQAVDILKKQPIEFKDIKGTEKLIEFLKIGGFRGGGDTVTAGSGITITTNGNGIKVISGNAGEGTLASVAANSLTTPQSLYTMHSGINVEFKTSLGASTLLISESINRVTVNQLGLINSTSASVGGATISGTSFISNYNGGGNPGNLFIGEGAGNFTFVPVLPNFTRNTGIGSGVLSSLTFGAQNTAIGYHAGLGITEGFANTLIGYRAGESITTGGQNIVIGSGMPQNTTGSNNISIGGGLSKLLTGDDTTAVGNSAGNQLQSGTGNSFYGNHAGGHGGGAGAVFDYNTIVGDNAAYDVNGSGNTVLGALIQVGLNFLGSHNILIGQNFEMPDPTLSNTLIIGNLIYGTGLDGTGTTVSSGNIGIGTSAPTFGKLQIVASDSLAGVFIQAGMTANEILLQTGSNLSGTYGWKLMQDEAVTGDMFLKSRTAGVDSTNPVIYFKKNGNVGIGTSSPTALLNLAAGTATASTAPLKFTSGTNLTSAEAGAMEWNGTNLFITQTSGPTRQTLAYISDLTSGYVPYTGATTDVNLGAHNLTIDTNTLFVDATNHRVGIGTASPTSALAFGTDAVIQRQSTDGADSGSLSISGAGGTAAGRGGYIKLYGNENTNKGFIDFYAGQGNNDAATAGQIRFFTASTVSQRLTIDYSGNILVGTATNSSNGIIQLNASTAIGGGIGFGTDTALYRSATGALILNATTGNASFELTNPNGQIGYWTTSGAAILFTSADKMTFGTNAVGGGSVALVLDTSQRALFGTQTTAGTFGTIQLKAASGSNTAGIGFESGAGPFIYSVTTNVLGIGANNSSSTIRLLDNSGNHVAFTFNNAFNLDNRGSGSTTFQLTGSTALTLAQTTLTATFAGAGTFGGIISTTGVGSYIYGTQLGSGGIGFSGDSSPDTGVIGYNYINAAGTESAPTAARASWRERFGNGTFTSWSLGYRAGAAGAGVFTEYLTVTNAGNATIAGTLTANNAFNLTTTGTTIPIITIDSSAQTSQQAILILKSSAQAWDIRNDGINLAFRDETAGVYPFQLIPGAIGVGGAKINSTTDSTTTGTGSLIVSGGVGIAKAVFIGTTLNVAGTTTLATSLTGVLQATSGVVSVNTTLTNTTSSTYTPTATNVTNITSSTPNNASYERVGNIVTVFGSITVTETLAVASQVDVSLPVASNLGAATDLNGLGNSDAAVASNIIIKGDATNDRASIYFTALSVGGNGIIYYSFQYKVI